MLAEIRRGNDHLGLADVVILEEDDLEQITNLLVVVDNGSNSVDQVYNLLGHPVARSSLATKDGDFGLELLPLLRRERLEGKIAVDDTKDVHLLALVLVDTLDLDVKEGRWVDIDTGGLLDVLGQADLVGILDLGPLLTEVGIVLVVLDLGQLGQILEEVLATGLAGDELGEARVGLVEPSAGSDTVGDVGELVGAKDLNEVLEDGGLDEIGVQLSNTVDLVRTNNSQVSHADHLGLSLLNDGDATKHIAVLGELALDGLEEEQVDVVDELEVAGQEMLEQGDGPLLESLGKDGVVGVTESVSDDAPGLIPIKALEIDENTLELNNSQSRVGVVQLDGNLFGELLPRALGLLESTDNIVEGSGNPEVLLLETKLLSAVEVVVGVKHGADGLSTLLVSDRVLVVAAIELLEVELSAGSLAGPQSQVVGRRSGIAGNGDIVSDSLDDLAAIPGSDGLAVVISPLGDMAVELNIDSDIVTRELPGVEVEPVVWHLDLVSVDDLLLEDTVAVPEAVTPGRVVEGSQTVEEAGSETAETTVSESSIVLLFDDILDSEAELGETSLGHVLLSDVEHGVVEGTAHEEL